MEAEENTYVRTLEDVNTVIEHAKLSRSDVKPTSQVIYFSSNFSDYKLLECNNQLLDYLSSGGEFVVRGKPEDKAVVCTSKHSFDLKLAETSNSLLLIPGLKMSDEIPDRCPNKENVDENVVIEKKLIVGVHGEYFELKKIRPRLGRLRQMLLEKPYGGPENETQMSDKRIYALEDFLQLVQGSQEEIENYLKEIEAVQIEDKWRLLDHEYQFRALSLLLNLIDEQSWAHDEVPIGETLSTLKGILPEAILLHICQIYLSNTDNYTEDGDQLHALNEYKVCRFLGETLLRPVEKFNLSDFLSAWESSVPPGLTTDLKQLAGLALYESAAQPPVIWYFPETDLSEDIGERFARLFQERRQWTYDQIAPYIVNVATDKQSVNSLLTKYARTSNVKGYKLYSSRHGK